MKPTANSATLNGMASFKAAVHTNQKGAQGNGIYNPELAEYVMPAEEQIAHGNCQRAERLEHPDAGPP